MTAFFIVPFIIKHSVLIAELFYELSVNKKEKNEEIKSLKDATAHVNNGLEHHYH